MNGYPLTFNYNGCIGEYPISQYLNIDGNLNTIISSTNELRFFNTNAFLTKVDSHGILRVYYTFNISAPTVNTQWLSVVDSLGYFYTQDANNQLQFTGIHNDISALSLTLGDTTITANSALALATTANGTATTALANGITNSTQISSINGTIPTLISSIILQIQNYINSNTLQDDLSFYISSNILSKQRYINSNSIQDIIGFYISSNVLSKQNYINSNSLQDDLSFYISSNIFSKQNHINSNSVQDIISFYISSNILSKQNYINSNSVQDNLSFFISSNVLSKQNYINSNSLQDDLSFYISSNILSKQRYINSNSLQDDLSFYISSNILSKQNYINSNSIQDIVSYYLPKTGGIMSGQITGITTLNATTGIFGTLSTTNNTNVAPPSVGNFGGTGDKIVIYNGTSSTYPYSIGINTNSLWYSAPSGASHNFYSGGTNTFTINGNGTSAITIVSNSWISSSDSNYRIYFANNDATLFQSPNGYSLRTEGGVSQLYISGSGNVGINTTNPSYNLDINGQARVYNGTSLTNFYIGNGSSASVLNLWDIATASWQIATGGYNLTISNGTINGTLTPRMTLLQNGNVGIGTNNPLTFLDVRGLLYLGGNSGWGTPANGWGNAGARIIFWNDSTDVSYSMGVNSATLWYAVPSGCSHLFYVGTSSILTINSSGAQINGTTTIGTASVSTLNCSGVLTADTFKTNTAHNNNIVLNNFILYPTLVGSGGYYLIDVGDYASQGWCYLQLSISSSNFYWLGRVLVASTGGIYYNSDWANAVSMGYISYYGRLCIMATPSTSPTFLQPMYVRIIG